MEKQTLEQILKSPYENEKWRRVLREVFGVREFPQRERDLTGGLNDRDRETAQKTVEIVRFETSNGEVVGCYRVDLTEKPRIWQNRVGLRSLLRNVYKHDVDAALVVFVQGDKWRLSFISEIRVLNDDGTIETKTTQPKRFTYLLGPSEKTNTPTQRLAVLAGHKLALEDIRKAFSVETLNKEFYGKVSKKFYELVGATEGKGKKQFKHERILKLPDTPNNARTKYQEFAVRLIGRIVFCWFLKEKKSEAGRPLISNGLIESEAVRKNYYHGILEPLFFETLNTPMDSRRDDLPAGCEEIPFLNGGLFEPHLDDHYSINKQTGISNHINTLVIPDEWFREFFSMLEEYNFTIDENSPVEIEISVDPEMLGRIFENLLAEIDPDSGESARKATGSFYTPREIVNYMVDESLILYLKGKLQTQNEDQIENGLRQLLSYNNSENPFDPKDTKTLIEAIDECKILDPACGSGAFPIGMLQRLVFILEKLDSKNKKWKSTQINKVNQLIDDAKNIEDHQIRSKIVGDLKKRKGEIESAFAEAELNFGRKLFLIENCIYGVDIQPIAAEISKLRCFLTLIIDETIDDTADNRGVKPLPNLEFKFVTADALLKLPESGLFNSNYLLKKLEKIRHDYIQSYGEEKAKLKADFKKLQDEIFDEQLANFAGNQDARALALSTWKPFSNEKIDWFDSEWMFGVKGFDIVIGNPPYIEFKRLSQTYKSKLVGYQSAQGKYDIYVVFMERSVNLLKEKGILIFIQPTTFLKKDFGKSIRIFIRNQSKIKSILDFSDIQVFDGATNYTGVFCFQRENSGLQKYTFPYHRYLSHKVPVDEFQKSLNEYESKLYKDLITVKSQELEKSDWNFQTTSKQHLLENIFSKSVRLEEITHSIFQGIASGKDEVFYIDQETIDRFKIEGSIVRRLLKGKDVKRFELSWSGNYVIFPYDQSSKVIPENILRERYPSVYKYLFFNRDLLSTRDYFNRSSKEWYELWNQRSVENFEKLRIVCPEISDRNNFMITDSYYGNTKTYHVILRDNEKLSAKFILGLLNSKLLDYIYKLLATPQAGGFYAYKTQFLSKLPIRLVSNTHRKTPFENLVDYILFLKELASSELINEYVPNSHLAEQFEEVIDALVYELYFEDDFRAANIEFLKYAERDFPPIDGLDHKKKIETIEAAYQRLRQKDNEIRNNLKLMDIRLADLIGPIKAAR